METINEPFSPDTDVQMINPPWLRGIGLALVLTGSIVSWWIANAFVGLMSVGGLFVGACLFLCGLQLFFFRLRYRDGIFYYRSMLGSEQIRQEGEVCRIRQSRHPMGHRTEIYFTEWDHLSESKRIGQVVLNEMFLSARSLFVIPPHARPRHPTEGDHG